MWYSVGSTCRCHHLRSRSLSTRSSFIRWEGVEFEWSLFSRCAKYSLGTWYVAQITTVEASRTLPPGSALSSSPIRAVTDRSIRVFHDTVAIVEIRSVTTCLFPRSNRLFIQRYLNVNSSYSHCNGPASIISQKRRRHVIKSRYRISNG